MTESGQTGEHRDPFRPGALFGKYKIEAFLGQGGMGKVYRALDTRLDRKVALKFVTARGGENLERFLREARHQAALEHEHICRVFEVGEIDDMAYIALQYIEGEPLLTAGNRMNLEQKVMVIRDVAEAIHEAHSQGLIHRDLKPENIMVRLTENGIWKPYVMDFGLVREIAAPGLTMTGMVLGTPAYMPPEQALGELSVLDRRSDIYSLGVSLYELLADEKPFPGKGTTELLIQVVEEEPVPLRKVAGNQPQDLENITMKCLEKEPGRRYENARLLARDLDNFLKGEPVMAKKTGPLGVLVKKARKNKLLSSVILAALVVTLFLGGLNWNLTRQKARQTLLAQTFGQRVERIENYIQMEFYLPVHNIRPARELVAGLIAQTEKEMGRDDFGRGIGHYSMGRAYLSLGRLTDAEENLQKAWDLGYRSPDQAWYLGRTLGLIYQDKVESLRKRYRTQSSSFRREAGVLSKQEWATEFGRELQILQDQYREPAIGLLEGVVGQTGMVCHITDGLTAFYRENYVEALQHLGRVTEMGYSLYESKRLEGDIRKFWGEQNFDDGRFGEALQHFLEADKAYDEALEIVRSDPDLYIAKLDCWQSIFNINESCGWYDDAQYAFTKAEELARKGLIIDPDAAIFHVYLSKAYTNWFSSLNDQGQDFFEYWDLSVQHGMTAVELDPQNVDGYLRLAYAHYQLGAFVGANRRNMWLFDKAAEFAEKALEIEPGYLEALNFLGLLHIWAGSTRRAMGEDPLPDWNATQPIYRSIRELDSEYDLGYSNACLALFRMMEYKLTRGQPVERDLEEALDYADQARMLNLIRPFNRTMAGRIHLIEGMAALEKGQDPSQHLDAAEEALQQSLQLNDRLPYPHRELARVHQQRARRAELFGDRPGPHLDRAVSAIDTAWDIQGGWPFHYYPAEIYLDQARRLLQEGGNPRPVIKRARMFIRNGMDINALAMTILLGRLETLAMLDDQSRWLEYRQAALQAFEKALEWGPDDPNIWLYLGELHSLAHRIDPKRDYYDAGLAAYARSLELNERNARTWLSKGNLLKQLDGNNEEARACIDKAIALNPLLGDLASD